MKTNKGLFLTMLLGFLLLTNVAAFAQKADAKNDDKQLGKDKEGRMIFEGPKGGKYYVSASGAKTYVTDGKPEVKPEMKSAVKSEMKNDDKQLGKDKEGRMIFEGPKGGKYYINASGAKSYIK